MSLPRPTVPTFEFVTNAGRTVKYRAHTMKEEKILLMAAAADDVTPQSITRAVRDILQACLIDQDIGDLSVSEVEELFVKVRSVSNSNTIDLIYTPPAACLEGECPDEIKTSANLDNVYMGTVSGKTVGELGYEKKKDGWVIMLTDTEGLLVREPRTMNTPEEAVHDAVIGVFSGAEFYSNEDFTKEELEAFLSELPSKCLDKVTEFFNSLPTVCLDVHVKCEQCGMERTNTIKGVYNFFA